MRARLDPHTVYTQAGTPIPVGVPYLGFPSRAMRDAVRVIRLALAGAASAEGVADAPGLGEAVAELVIGAVVGGAVGVAGGWVLRWACRRR